MKQAHLYKVKPGRSARALAVTIAVSCCLLVAFLVALNNTNANALSEEAAQLETAIRRACVTCYAVEGRYPANLEYLTDRYGVIIDTDRYSVRYDAFAENLLPDISVVRRGEVRG